jgi:hypothetical protein
MENLGRLLRILVDWDTGFSGPVVPGEIELQCKGREVPAKEGQSYGTT